MGSPIGRRVQVIGNSFAGKSTLAARLARVLEVPCIELDALNREPDWVGLPVAVLLWRVLRRSWCISGSFAWFPRRRWKGSPASKDARNAIHNVCQ